ncbi:lipopolysaccharide biosynthesis protein [Sphingopyxis yananensis]|uniref:lipopolysaccharide biosynthesis protein n=1 Tax=Sphingopyxis yananensis TaxID=2886687 RepID=UPI001D0FC81B|nr:lipopolysaccharide biosynthesis protein [Sphingopyxis yananensis]MCC2603174.1 lipopolysaccharide biosynthesis protein [Sphingopyxis yananensis]
MANWFSDGSFRAILRNASYLASSKLGSAILGLVALSFAGRGLTPALFGTLVVVQAYAYGVSALVKFQTWQFIVRFGAPALIQKDLDRFRDVTGFSFGLDLASGAVGLIAGMALLPFISTWVGIAPKDLHLALLYCTLIPIMTAATPTGILRTLDRFDHIAVQQLVTPLLWAMGSGVSYFANLGFAGFVISWYLAELVGDLLLWFFAARELRRQNIHRALRPALFAPARRIKGAWDFVWTTNIAHSIWSAWGPASNVIVGGLLGPSAAGLFKIASTFFEAASKPANLMDKSFYPEIMRLHPASKQPWLLAVRSGLLAGGVGLVVLLLVVIGGKPLIALAFGQSYVEAFDLLQIMTASLLISMMTFPLESLLYMASKQRAALVAEGLAALLYALLLVMLIHSFGLVGAGIAYVCGMCLKAFFTFIPTLSAYRHRHTLSHSKDLNNG